MREPRRSGANPREFAVFALPAQPFRCYIWSVARISFSQLCRFCQWLNRTARYCTTTLATMFGWIEQ